MENDSQMLFKESTIARKNKSNYNKFLKLKQLAKNKIKNVKINTDTLIKDKIVKNDINHNEQKGNNQTNKKIRNPGIDTVRIIAMYAIISHHFLFDGQGSKYFPKYKRQITLWHILMDWHNDGFILLSGVVGYKSNKYSNLLYLWLTTFFYSVGIHKYVTHYKKTFLINQEMYKEYFPIVFERYWYFTAYFGMKLFTPVINKGIAYLTKKEFRLVVLSTLVIIIFWRDFKNPKEDIFKINRGMSMVWHIIYYLTGAYIGKYHVDYSGIKKYIYCLICIFTYAIPSYLYFKISQNEFSLGKKQYQIEIENIIKRMLNDRLDSFLRIVQSISVILFFMQIHYYKYIAKVICFIGPLIFGVYLTHNHKVIKENISKRFFVHLDKKLSLNAFFNLLLLKALKMFVCCITIDYLRHLLFTLLRIRKILVVLENKLM